MLRYKFHPGTTLRYSFTVDFGRPTGKSTATGSMGMVIAMKVLSVAPDGTATIKSSLEKNNMGAMMGNNTMPPVTSKFAPTGPLGTAGGLSQSMNALPQKAVSTGATWSSSFSLGGGSQDIPVHNKLLKIVNVGGSNIAFIETTGTVKSPAKGSTPASAVHVVFEGKFNITKGWVEEESGTATPSQMPTMKVRFTMKKLN
jgi:hypothetical protein